MKDLLPDQPPKPSPDQYGLPPGSVIDWYSPEYLEKHGECVVAGRTDGPYEWPWLVIARVTRPDSNDKWFLVRKVNGNGEEKAISLAGLNVARDGYQAQERRASMAEQATHSALNEVRPDKGNSIVKRGVIISMPKWSEPASETPPKKSPAELMKDLIEHEGLTEDDIFILNRYSRFNKEVRECRLRGDTGGSNSSQQLAGQTKRKEMRPDAQRIADRYCELWLKI